MPLDPDTLRAWSIPEVVQSYGSDDLVGYALAVGYGHDPMDSRQLRFVNNDKPAVAPTYPVVLGYPGAWMQDPGTGIDWLGVLHGEQSLVLHAPLPAAATIVGRSRVTAVVDKGAKGAVVHTERTITDLDSGVLLATLGMATFCRGVGGFDGGDEAPAGAPALPERAPDLVHDLPTLPQSALLYRLCGDRNPLHVDPDVAARAGFDRPILHGLCTFGVAGHALVATVADYDPTRLRAISARFSAPVFPGERLRTEIWREDTTGTVRFRVRALDRDVVVLDRGTADLQGL